MDGPSTNFAAMKKFGCKFTGKLDKMTGKFNYPAFNHPIFFIPDAVHMLKLGRNALADLGSFTDGEGKKIEWRFISALHDVQQEEGLKFGNKISAKHIEFERNKMNVKLAAQVLSNSVADAIEFLQQAGDPRFKNSEGTVKFIRTVDCLFDLLNSRNPHSKGYKKPLRLLEKTEWSSTVERFINYLYSLKDAVVIPSTEHVRERLGCCSNKCQRARDVLTNATIVTILLCAYIQIFSGSSRTAVLVHQIIWWVQQ